MARRAAALVSLLPLAARGLRLEADAEAFSTGSTLGEDSKRFVQWGTPAGNGSNSSEWPDNWMVAHEHGKMIAHQLDEDTLFRFVHAYSGPPASHYAAQTIPLPQFKIPALKMHDAVPGWDARTPDEARRVTSFPSYLALASSWDKDLVYDVAMAVSEEFKTLGANTMLGPAINIHRSTQHDEEFDSLSGEDPVLGSILVRSWILATQTHGIMTIPKSLGKAEQDPVHFENASSNLTSWDIYYPAFATAIDCGAAGIMCASHEVNGLWSCRDREMLERDLKGIMGFHGLVMSGPGTARDYFPYASSYEKGLDLELDEPEIVPRSGHALKGMRKAAARVLASIWHSRLEEDMGCKPGGPCVPMLHRNATSPEHLAVAERAAGSGIVLLKNDDGALPLEAATAGRVAVFGPAAARAWNSLAFDTPFHAMQDLGKGLGFELLDNPDGADVCVVLGESGGKHWELSKDTGKAISLAISKSCAKTIVFLELRGTVMTPWRDEVQALAVTFPVGQEMAFSWAATLFGTESSPSGKLPIGLPDADQEVREWWTEVPPSYWDKDARFAYPFGHGLSYAQFEYHEAKQKPLCHFPLCLMVTVRNASPKYSGAEVVQIYFKFPGVASHPTVLRGFHKTKVLPPGGSEKVFFPFTYRDVSLYHDVGNHTEPESSWSPQEKILVLIGSSSKDVRKAMILYPRYS